MKKRIITATIIIMLILLLVSRCFAATGTVELKASTIEVKKGETFTVTLSATSEDGINGIDTKYSYDSDKLELVDEKVSNPSNWSNIGETPNITIICNSTQSLKNADIYVLIFRVRDNVNVGDSLKVETTEILLDTDAQNDSEVKIPSKKIVVNVKDAPEENSNQKNQQSNESEDKRSQADNNPTVAKGTLPKTGENLVAIIIFLMIIIVLSIIVYKKYMQYKDI